MGIRFLTLAEILLIHADQIENYGGIHGTRDIHLYDLAIAVCTGQAEKNTLPVFWKAMPSHMGRMGLNRSRTSRFWATCCPCGFLFALMSIPWFHGKKFQETR